MDIINSDYRCNQYRYSNADFLFQEKKRDFEDKVKNAHPRLKNFYRNVKKKEFSKNFDFKKTIYNNSCVYCGLSALLIPKSTFEIDHVLPKAIKEDNGLYNIVCACKYCNRKKSHFHCKISSNQELLHPDNNHLQEIFYRDSNYYIKINDLYKANDDITQFYQQLGLGEENKRLEYLILEIRDFCESYPKDSSLLNLRLFVNELREKWSYQA